MSVPTYSTGQHSRNTSARARRRRAMMVGALLLVAACTVSLPGSAGALSGTQSGPGSTGHRPAPGRPAPSWAKYVVAPTSRDVRPVKVLASSPKSADSSVTNPQGVLGHGAATLTRTAPPAKPRWPAGTTATASSFHAPNEDNGQPRTYAASNAVDGDPTTFWNDDTIAEYPDVLTITAPSAVTLPGITLLSSSDGVPQDYTVEA